MLDYKVQQKERVIPRSLLSNLLILGASAGLLVWSSRLIQQKMTTVTSVDAVINGALSDIKAPQEGTISGLGLKTGDIVTGNQTLLTLKNDRVGKLQIQEINSRLQQQQAQLTQAQAELSQQLALIQTLKLDQENQQRLEVLQADNSIEVVKSEIPRIQAAYNLAATNYKRYDFLARQGAVSRASVDAIKAEMDQRKAEISNLQTRINALRANQQAARLGLTLSKTRSNFDPRIRLQETQMQIVNQRQNIETIKRNIESIKSELAQANADLKLKQAVVVNAPTSGVVWRLEAQEGKVVQQGESLGQVLDCNKRWVDVFVDERAVKSIEPGTPAKVELYGASASVLSGQVSMIRSGVGRLNAGQEIAVPFATNSPRNTQIRVEINADKQPVQPGFFCYVGYTGKVTFEIK